MTGRHMQRNPRRLFSVVCALLLAVTCWAPAMAAETYSQSVYGIVRNPNGGAFVNVRAGASYNATVLTTVNVGAQVQITGADGAWYSVFVNGVLGFIHSSFINTQTSNVTATVVGGGLNMREAPTMRARVIRQLPTGTSVTVLDASDATWTQIQSGGVIGYVMTSFLSIGAGTSGPIPPSSSANATVRTVNGGNLNLRVRGSSSAAVIASYPSGTRVRVLAYGDYWCHVRVGSVEGYMSTRFLSFDSGSGGSGTGSAATGNAFRAVVNNPGGSQYLNLRQEPSVDSRSLGQYYNGTTVAVYGVGKEWHRVSVGGVSGYMSAQFVSFIDSGATPNKTVRNSGSFVNLRSGPGYQHGVLKQVQDGAAATVLIPYPAWSQVMVRDGGGYLTGYMLNIYLK